MGTGTLAFFKFAEKIEALLCHSCVVSKFNEVISAAHWCVDMG